MNTFANIKTITKRELAAYFSSPIAYVFLVIFLLLWPSSSGGSAAIRTWGRRRTPPTNSPSRPRKTCRRGRS